MAMAAGLGSAACGGGSGKGAGAGVAGAGGQGAGQAGAGGLGGQGGQGCVAPALMSGPGGAIGTPGPDAGSPETTFLFTFDRDYQGFTIEDYRPGGGNLYGVDGGAPLGLLWDGTVGYPTAGSLRLGATYTDYNQFVFVSLTASPTFDVTGKTLHAWVALDPIGCGMPFSGTVQLQASSDPNHPVLGTPTALTPGRWTELTLDLSNPPSTFDPTQLVQLAMTFSSGPSPDGGRFPGSLPVVFHIDSISDGAGAPATPLEHTFDRTTQSYSLTGPATADGGAGGGSGGMLAFDSSIGDPSPGSLAATIPFTGPNQTASVQVNLWPFLDLVGKTIHAKVMLDAVGSPPAGVYAEVHASAPDFVREVFGTAATLAPGVWTDISLSIPDVKLVTFEPTEVIQVGVTLGTPTTGSFTGGTLHFHVDTIIAE